MTLTAKELSEMLARYAATTGVSVPTGTQWKADFVAARAVKGITIDPTAGRLCIRSFIGAFPKCGSFEKLDRVDSGQPTVIAMGEECTKGLAGKRCAVFGGRSPYLLSNHHATLTADGYTANGYHEFWNLPAPYDLNPRSKAFDELYPWYRPDARRFASNLARWNTIKAGHYACGCCISILMRHTGESRYWHGRRPEGMQPAYVRYLRPPGTDIRFSPGQKWTAEGSDAYLVPPFERLDALTRNNSRRLKQLTMRFHNLSRQGQRRAFNAVGFGYGFRTFHASSARMATLTGRVAWVRSQGVTTVQPVADEWPCFFCGQITDELYYSTPYLTTTLLHLAARIVPPKVSHVCIAAARRHYRPGPDWLQPPSTAEMKGKTKAKPPHL
jgi:hypothetical protein